jgi:GGDEF domain-containing protein
MGGDEFVLLLEDLGTQRETAEQATRVIAAKIHEALAMPAQLGAVPYSGSASLGVVLFTDADADPKSLVQAADAAMYGNKRAVAH